MGADKCSSLLLLATAFLCLIPAASASGAGKWVTHGGDIRNRRYAQHERLISPKTASSLALKWEFVVNTDITATPAIYKGAIYFPAWNGNLYAVNQTDGSLLWSKNLTQLTGFTPEAVAAQSFGISVVVARATPAVSGGVLVLGLLSPATIIAVDRFTGDLLWSRRIEIHPFSVITAAGTIHGGHFYVGVSSVEEGAGPGVCCSFVGSLQKLDIKTGRVLWKTLTLPDNGGKTGSYSGAAIWGSSPPIDERLNLVLAATGNVYTVPPAIEACAESLANVTIPTEPDPCVEPENRGNSILAFDLTTGEIVWSKVFGGYDAWNLGCARNLTTCPAGPALDHDFGEEPMLLTIKHPNGTGPHHRLDIAVAGQKSGVVWAVRRDTGDVVWASIAGPGGSGGGAIWGAATDGSERAFTNINNFLGRNFTLLPSNAITTGGGWVGINATTGAVIWTTAAPGNGTDSRVRGPVTLANGVLFVGSFATSGDVYALDAQTGTILWHSTLPVGSVYGGFSVSDGCAFVGAGYAVSNSGRFNGGTLGRSLYAFCVPVPDAHKKS